MEEDLLYYVGKHFKMQKLNIISKLCEIKVIMKWFGWIV